MEPEFLSEKLLEEYENAEDWIRGEAREMRAKGATFFRATKHNQIENLVLVEGWKKQPKDQGKPRFQYERAARR